MTHWEINDFDWEDLGTNFYFDSGSLPCLYSAKLYFFIDLDSFELDGLDEELNQDCKTLTDMAGSTRTSLNLRLEAKQKRKRKRKYSDETREMLKAVHERDKLLRPRILRSDFRRQFANMCTNVFNSGDYRFVMEYINTYCSHEVVVRHMDLRPCNKIGIPGLNLDITGQESLARYWYTAMTNCPDVVCLMHNATVKVRSDGTATVKCDFELRGNAVLIVHKGLPDASHSLFNHPTVTPLEDTVDSPEIVELLERYARANRIMHNAQQGKRCRTQKHSIIHSHVASNAMTTTVGAVGVVDSQQSLQTLDQRVLSPAQVSAAVRHLLSTSDETSSEITDKRADNFELQMGPQGQLVITAATDVLCSYEIVFNAESRVASVSVFCRK